MLDDMAGGGISTCSAGSGQLALAANLLDSNNNKDNNSYNNENIKCMLACQDQIVRQAVSSSQDYETKASPMLAGSVR